MKHNLISLFFLLPFFCATAQTVSFDTATDLDAYTIGQSSANSLQFGETAGLEGEGGLIVPASDRRVHAFRTAPVSSAGRTTFRTAIAINVSEFTSNANQNRGEINLGFLATATPPSGDQDKLFDKNLNENFHVVLKFEHRQGSKDREVELEVKSVLGNNDDKSNKPSVQGNVAFDDWMTLELVGEQTGPESFTLTARLLNAGGDQVIATNPLPVNNAGMANATHWFVGFSYRQRAGLPFYLDEHEVEINAEPPESAEAEVPTLITNESALLTWDIPNPLPLAESYTLELAPGSLPLESGNFLSATGTSGQTNGIDVTGLDPRELLVTGLDAGIDYHFQIRAGNAAGDAVSNVVTFTTATGTVNLPPTLDPIPDPAALLPGPKNLSIDLTGISPGLGEESQFPDLTVTATVTSDPDGIVLSAFPFYNPPQTEGLLLLATTGIIGEAVITVTVNDNQGALAETFSQSFTLRVAEPPEFLTFADAADVETQLVRLTSGNTVSWSETGGTEGSGTLVIGNAADADGLIHRALPFENSANTTILRTSMRFHLGEFDVSSPRNRSELRLGISPTLNIPSSLRNFFNTNQNSNVNVRLEIDNENGKREVKMRLFSIVGNSEVRTNDTTDNPINFDTWLELELVLIPTGSNIFTAYAFLWDEADRSQPIRTHGPLHITNGPLAQAEVLYPAIAFRHRAAGANLPIDQYRAQIGAIPPASPLATGADPVGQDVALLTWDLTDPFPAIDGFTVQWSTDETFATFATDDQTDPELLELGITGLTDDTTYFYRVAAFNSAGASVFSAPVSFTTLVDGSNQPPTIDPVADILTQPSVGTLTVALSGISPGFLEEDQFPGLLVTAVSNNPAVVDVTSLDWTQPSPTADLNLALLDEGIVTITITLDDQQPADNLTEISFTVEVKQPPEVLDFTEESQFTHDLITGSSVLDLSWESTGGIADTGRIVVGASPTTRGEAYLLRAQPFDPTGASIWQTSVKINLAEYLSETGPGQRSRGEVSIGFSVTDNIPSEFRKFFDKNENDNIHIKLKIEHRPGDKDRELEIEVKSVVGNNDVKSSSPKSEGMPFDNWLELELTLIPLGNDQFEASAVIYDLGPDGTSPRQVLLSTNAGTYTNAPLANANPVIPAIALDNRETNARYFLDDYRVVIGIVEPDAPMLETPSQIWAQGFRLDWSPDTTGFVTEYIVEIAADEDFINIVQTIDGITDPELLVTGLTPSATYFSRVLAAIDDLESEFSNVVSATTLALGENAPPTLDPIVGDFVFSTEDGPQSVLLTGISTGGEPAQTITVSATVDDSDVVTLGSITYTPNDTNGSLAFTSVGSGEAVITVSVSDGEDTVVQRFTVFVFDPITVLNFDQEADFARFLVTQEFGTLTWNETGERLRFQGDGVDEDQVAVAFGRPATLSSDSFYDSGSFEIRARVRVDDIVNTSSDRADARIYLGFARDAVADESKLKDSLHKGDIPAFGLDFRVEHRPAGSDSQQRSLRLELFNNTGSSDSSSSRTDLSQVAELDEVLELVFRATRFGTNYILFAEVYALGANGDQSPVLIAENGAWSQNNAPIRLAASVFPAFQIETRKETTEAVELLSLAVDVNPELPWALAVNAASDITSDSAVISWTDTFDGPDFSDVVIDVWPAAEGFDSANKVTVTAGGFATTATLSDLSPATAYRFRVRPRTTGGLLGAYDFDRTFTTQDPPPLDFEAWALQVELPSGALPEDPTPGGGVTNLQAWIHGLNPGIPQSFSDFATQDITDDRLTLTVRVRDVSPGYTVEVRGTNNLTADWDLPLQVVEQSPVDPEGFVTLTVRTQSPEDIAFLGVWILGETP